MDWLPGFVVIVYLVVKLLIHVPLLRQWTVWVGSACALATLGHLARVVVAGEGISQVVAAFVSGTWAVVFLREGVRMSARGGQRSARGSHHR